MTPIEKAQELVDKYNELLGQHIFNGHFDISQQCALIAVDFAMNSKYSFQPMHGGWVSGKLHYEELKQEIEKL